TLTTLTCTDNHGASSSCSANVTVVDKTAPAVSCPVPTIASANALCKAPIPNVIPGVKASDNCTPFSSLIETGTPPAGTLVGLGTTTITVIVADAAGNSSSCSTSLTVADTTPPTVTTAVGTALLWPPNHDLVNVGF